jgi:hypothetical protein
MSTDTPTSLQNGVTPNPIASNTQDFSHSDNDILDNFGDGPDDGIPMGLGGEKGKQSEPASTTLESDIVNGTTPGVEPETAAADEPVEDASEEGSEVIPEPEEEPETPEFPQMLLQMAGLTDASAALAAGFQTPESLLAAIKWRGQLLASGAQPAQPSEQGLYRTRPVDHDVPPASPAKATPKPEGETKPFQFPEDKLEGIDDELLETLRQMHSHYESQGASHQRELESLRAQLEQREQDIAMQNEHEEEAQFDEIVQNLGENWRDVFGEGSGRDLANVGQANPVAMTNFNHRRLLFDTVQSIREVNAKQGYRPWTLEQEVQWALAQRYPDKFQQIISGNSKKSGTRQGVTASRPTQRKTPPKSQNAKVLSDVNAMLRKKHGYALDIAPKEEFDGEI